MKTITLKADNAFDATLTELARRMDTTKSAVIREAVGEYKAQLDRKELRERLREASLRVRGQGLEELELWDVTVADYREAYAITVAPLALDGKVIVGIAGGEFGIRGFLDAYDAKTGKRLWRFWTVPGPGEPGHDTWSGESWKSGAAGTWITGAYDPGLNLVYWGTGNPGPDFAGENRKGDNLYTESMVALDADTGKMKWYFQFTPHDVHDWDAVEIPVLVDAAFKGRPRKLLVQANRNGFYYVLDRVTGEFLHGTPFIKELNWAKGLDEKGRPIRVPGITLHSGENELLIQRDNGGSGQLYYMALLNQQLFYDGFTAVTSVDQGLALQRSYKLVEGTARPDGAYNIGDLVEVTLEMEARERMHLP